MANDTHWPDYYAVTVDRPAWGTVIGAAERFVAEGSAAEEAATIGRWFAVDLGCGAGRDTRELLRRGWRVLAIDREPAAIETLEAATDPADRDRLSTLVADLATVELPPCDLVNASVSLPFLGHADYDAVLARIVAAVRPGGRFAAMLYADRDASAGEPDMTCPPVAAIRAALPGFEFEEWSEREEDGQTALGDPHHFHLVEFVARRTG